MSTLLSLILALAAAGFIWSHWVEPNWFRLREVRVRTKKRLPEPLSILHLSDLHFTGRQSRLERFFDQLSRLEPDFVFVTGDLIDNEAGIEPCVENLKKLRPRQGTYVVLGNHDYCHYPFINQIKRIITKETFGVERSETESLKQALQSAGLHLLTNENVPVALAGNGEAVLIGIDDPVTGKADLSRAFKGIENGALRIVLVHAPWVFPALGRRGVDVAFAGHTHGGQIRLPGVGPLPWAYRIEPIIDSTDRYGFVGLVSRGMGASPVLRLRFLCRPEAVLVRIEGSLDDPQTQ